MRDPVRPVEPSVMPSTATAPSARLVRAAQADRVDLGRHRDRLLAERDRLRRELERVERDLSLVDERAALLDRLTPPDRQDRAEAVPAAAPDEDRGDGHLVLRG